MPPRSLLAVLALLALSGAARRVETPTGPVEVELAAVGRGPREGIGRGVIDAPPERVYRALTDYAHWEEFMPFLEESDARAQADGSVLSRHRLDLPAPQGERRYEIRARHAAEEGPKGRVWRVSWASVPGSGNVAGHRGSWTLTAQGAGRTLAVLRLWTDPGGAVPAWAADRGTARMLPWVFHGLRQHVRRSRYDLP